MNGVLEVGESIKMKSLEVSGELKSRIENVQLQLQNAIRNHQVLKGQKKEELADETLLEQLESDVQEAQYKVVLIGKKQEMLLNRLREEYKAYQATVATVSANGAVQELKLNLSHGINRNRKQNLLPRKSTSPIHSYENEPEAKRPPSPLATPEDNPVNFEDMDQVAFLSNFCLATHENFIDMQKKRAERKRRSTANPQFVYGSKGWDFLGPTVKRKRSSFLAHPPSPPYTRGRKNQGIMKKLQVHPTVTTNGNHSEKTIINSKAGCFIPLLPGTFPPLKNLPPGLVIEPISPTSNPDSQRCIICKQPGALSLCEHCTNGFHMSCHNRPFSRTPKQCPKCLRAKIREDRLLACNSSSSSNSDTSGSSAMSVDFNRSPTPTEVSEKLELRQQCREKRAELVAELTQLQNRHSELIVGLKNQDVDRQRLAQNQKTTEAKIDELIRFVETVKRISVPDQVI